MSVFQKISLLILRLSLGWMMLYAGWSKVANPQWSAAGYLKGATTFPEFYQALLDPSILPVINFMNQWGLTLLGISLIVGAFVKLSSWLGAMLMLMYYFPVLQFPMAGEHSYIVDDHIIYAVALVFLALIGAGRYWGVDEYLAKKYPKMSRLI